MERWSQQFYNSVPRKRETEVYVSEEREDYLKQLKVSISLYDMLKIQTFVDECPSEISGLSKLNLLAPIGFKLSQPFILEQEVSGSSTDLTEAAAKFLMRLVQKGQSPAPYKFWWHSHVNMDVWWSPQDEETARGFGNVFMVSMVINRKREYLLRLDQFEPFRLTIYNLPLHIEIVSPKRMVESCKREINEKVKEPVYSIYNPLNRIFRSGTKETNLSPWRRDVDISNHKRDKFKPNKESPVIKKTPSKFKSESGTQGKSLKDGSKENGKEEKK